MIDKKEPKCLYCGEAAGYYQNPNYKVKRPKKYCSNSCGDSFRVRKGLVDKDCLYCGVKLGIGNFGGPQKSAKFCSTKCGVRHGAGFVHSEVMKSKIPEGVLLDPEDRIRALELVDGHINSKWSYKSDTSGYIVTTVEDPDGGVIRKKWRGREWDHQKRKEVWLHRFVLGIGEKGDVFVAHLNGNRDDCRKSNLKVMTQEEAVIWKNANMVEDVIVENVAKKKMTFDTKHGIREVFFDPEDWDVIKIYPWSIKHKRAYSNGRYTDYAQARIPHPDGSVIIKQGGPSHSRPRERHTYHTKRMTYIGMHRLIMGLGPAIEGSQHKDLEVDHRDKNGLNNCKENLRVCNHSQNSYNKRHHKNSAVPFKGVQYRADYAKLIKQGLYIAAAKIKKPYVAQISFNKRKRYLGSFGSAEEAARAHDIKALELHGEFAYLNFPERYEEYMAELKNTREKNLES